MELSRRDALVALGAAGAAAGGFGVVSYSGVAGGDPAPVVRALAETVYPSEVTVDEQFVETYLRGRADGNGNGDGGAGGLDVAALTRRLDGYARRERGAAFVDLAPDDREALLRDRGVDVVPPDPDGTATARLRFLVDDLLYALYATPTGGKLVGNPNPTGYPGGTDHYQRGPER